MRWTAFAFLLLLYVSSNSFAQGTRLLRHPTVSRDSIAFEYAGDLWIVPRSGGVARRLTSTPTVEIDPYFSPDGSQIAFTATVAGNTDVYVVPASGGDPKRLTYHPGVDRVRGWTPRGRRVIFAPARAAPPTQHCPTRCRRRARSVRRIHRTAGASRTKRFLPSSFLTGTRRVCGGII